MHKYTHEDINRYGKMDGEVKEAITDAVMTMTEGTRTTEELIAITIYLHATITIIVLKWDLGMCATTGDVVDMIAFADTESCMGGGTTAIATLTKWGMTNMTTAFERAPSLLKHMAEYDWMSLTAEAAAEIVEWMIKKFAAVAI